MLRTAFIGITALGFIAGTASAQDKMDCGALYKGYMEKLHADVGLEGNKFVALHRLALRGYDACSAGDEFNARDFWDEIDRYRR